MTPLSKEIIQKLTKEKDPQVLAEVLDFYDYIKQKKLNTIDKQWQEIEEIDPEEDELRIINEYESSEKEFTSLDMLMKELDSDG